MSSPILNVIGVKNGKLVQLDDILADMMNDTATLGLYLHIYDNSVYVHVYGESKYVSAYKIEILSADTVLKSWAVSASGSPIDISSAGHELPMQYFDIRVTAYSVYGRVMGVSPTEIWYNGTSLPKCAPMTLRMRFQNATYAPVNEETGESVTTVGTWNKLDCDENIWDWTYDDPVWNQAFLDVFTDANNKVDIVDAGDTTALKSCGGLFASKSQTSYIVHICWFETKNVYMFKEMFFRCRALQSIPFFNTSGATSMVKTFYMCELIQNLPPLDTHNVTTMQSLFYKCYALQKAPMMDTSKVNDMSQMFMYCEDLVYVPEYNTDNVTTMYSMFAACESLLKLPWMNTSKVTNMKQFVYGCKRITDMPPYDTRSVTTMEKACENCTALIEFPWMNTSNCTNFELIFASCKALKRVASLDTSKATSLKSMFQHCHELETVGFYDASNATTIEGMYFCCTKLKRVNDMPVKLTCYMKRVFDTLVESSSGNKQYESSLEEIPNWDWTKASTLERAFRGCTKLKTIPDMGVPVNATTCERMFENCPNIESGISRAYTNLSASSTITKHANTFTQCGTATESGMAERTQVPTSWGGDMA